jgi:hypothetical protein
MSLTEADRTEIQDLYGRYGLLIDAGDADGWADCFTEDGRMTVGDQLDFSGRDQLHEFVRSHHAGDNAVMRHHITSTSVSASEGGAAGRSYALVTAQGQVVAAMTYEDELVKDGGAWRFSKRTVTPQ